MEILIVAAEVDARALEYSIEDIYRHTSPEKINIVTDIPRLDDKTRQILENKCDGRVRLIDETEIYRELTCEEVRRSLEERIGSGVTDHRVELFKQQFMMLAYGLTAEAKEYLVMEPDVVPLRKLAVRCPDGKLCSYSAKGVKEAGIMPFVTDIVRQLVRSIETDERLKGGSFWERLIESADREVLAGNSFSIYGVYREYVRKHYPDKYEEKRISILNRARRLLGKQPSQPVKDWAGKSYDCMKLRRCDRPSEPLVKLNNSKLVQTVIPARFEDSVDARIEMLSDKWVKICRFSVRENVGIWINRFRNLRRYLEGRRKKGYSVFLNVEGKKDGCVVLTHSGTRPIPEYAVDCIEQILFYSDTTVYFVCSRDKEISPRLREIARIVYIEDLPVSERHLRFFKKLSSFGANFDNFFQHATERFFIIDEVIECLGLTNVIHMENDIMIYEDINVLIGTMKKLYDCITVPRMTEEFCMATVMYIPDHKRMEHFLDYVLEHILDKKSNDVSKKTNDMIILADYLRENGKYALPLINKEYIDEYGLINSKGAVPPGEHLDDYYKYTETFGGIFDPQPMGQYLGGTDRKPKGVANNAGFKNEYSYVDISKLDIIWKKKGEGYVPVLKWKDKEYRIYDLHVHCKELNRFRSDIAREG